MFSNTFRIILISLLFLPALSFAKMVPEHTRIVFSGTPKDSSFQYNLDYCYGESCHLLKYSWDRNGAELDTTVNDDLSSVVNGSVNIVGTYNGQTAKFNYNMIVSKSRIGDQVCSHTPIYGYYTCIDKDRALPKELSETIDEISGVLHINLNFDSGDFHS